MDEVYLMATVRYVERNPVVAKLCRTLDEWEWSSAAAHTKGVDDELVTVQPMLERVGDWRAYLTSVHSGDGALEMIKRQTRTGRPLGDQRVVNFLGMITGRELKPKKPGPKPIGEV